MKSLRDQISDRCIHFRAPFSNDSCEAGHKYRTIAGGGRAGYLARLPCIRNSPLGKNVQSCPDLCFPTEQEIDKGVAEYEKIIERIEEEDYKKVKGI